MLGDIFMFVTMEVLLMCDALQNDALAMPLHLHTSF